MTIDRLNPPELHATPGYHHVTIARTARTAYLAGQCPVAADGKVVGGDIRAQVDRVIANTVIALAAAGATPADVVRTVVYVASDEQPVLSEVWDRLAHSEIGEAFTAASTLLGVARLGFSGQLVELDVTAAIG